MKSILTAPAFMARLMWATTCTTLFATLMSGTALAQSAPPSSTDPARSQAPSPTGAVANQTGQPLRIAPGTVIPVELTKTIDAKKAKAGDEVLAKVSKDLKTASGEIIVPKDTKVVGHVTEAQARNKDQKESEVGIAFDHAVTKSGNVQLPMSIQAIIVASSNPSDNGGGGYGQTGPATATSPMSNRDAPMEGLPRPPSPSAVPTGENNPLPPITSSTHGVIGMPDVKLEETTRNAAQGSVVTSEKSNVKLESGTVMLLRVNE